MNEKLILSDGTIYEGESFGAPFPTSGEIVFNTGMMGYPESLTDPSYYGQILVLTYPLIGNYGVPDKSSWESKKIQVKGLIVQNYIENYSHFEAEKSLAAWLKEENIPALQGIDTRALTTKLRAHGVMLGRIESRVESRESSENQIKSRLQTLATSDSIYDPNSENVLPFVSVNKPIIYGSSKKTIVLIDCGAKENIVRSLIKRGVKVMRVPWDWQLATKGETLRAWVKKGNFDGVLISNGPGDPKQAAATIQTIKNLISQSIPTFGICLGSQLLALASGADTFKLKFGHRSQNQPCQDVFTKKCIITSQNHGFAVDKKSLQKDWSEWFINLNDGTNEGIRHKKKPFLSVQFHPESTPGPTDANYLFDEFISLI